MMHPDTELAHISSEVGSGVFATAFIPSGTLIWVQDLLDIVLTPEAVQKLDELYHRSFDHYAYRNQKGDYILCWDAGRFINHCCDASTCALGNIASIACRDIQAGEQLTEDYASFNLAKAMDCHCGASNCRRHIAPDDILRIHALLDSRSTRAMQTFSRVPQPLMPLLNVEQRLLLEDVAAGRKPPLSCLDNRYQGR